MKLKGQTYILLLLLSAMLGCNQSESSEANVEQRLITDAQIIDLSYEYSDETVYWVTAEEFSLDTVFAGETDKGYYYSAFNFTTAEHGGTHIDAPIHFSKSGRSVDEIPLEQLMGKAVKIDVSARASSNPDYEITAEDLIEWEAQHGRIPDGSVLLLQTGFGDFYPDKEKYLGTNRRGDSAVVELHFPGLSAAASQWLVDNRVIKAVGIDTPSIDFGQSTHFESHVILMDQNIPAFENLDNLEKLPPTDFEIIALPMKIAGGSGGPLRIVALVYN